MRPVTHQPCHFISQQSQLTAQREENERSSLKLAQAQKKISQQDAIIKELQEKAQASARIDSLDEALSSCRQQLAESEVRTVVYNGLSVIRPVLHSTREHNIWSVLYLWLSLKALEIFPNVLQVVRLACTYDCR